MTYQSTPERGTAVRSGGALLCGNIPIRANPRFPVHKMVFDRLFAAVMLIVLAPVFAIFVVAILVTDGRPVFFGHRRVGLNGSSFRCWKFRTMVHDAEKRLAETLDADPTLRAEWEATRKLRNDPRINRIGQFLRKTSLDELPQFWNVLTGDMSVVGPRPVVREELELYRGHAGTYTSVKPGVTGAWQVSGRSNTTYDERVAMDVNYIRHNSLLGDLWIVMKTVLVVLGRNGAH